MSSTSKAHRKIAGTRNAFVWSNNMCSNTNQVVATCAQTTTAPAHHCESKKAFLQLQIQPTKGPTNCARETEQKTTTSTLPQHQVDHRIPRHLTQIAANSGKPEGQPPPPLKKPTTLLQGQHKGALDTRVCKRLRQPEHETTASDDLTASVTSYQRHCPGSVTCHHTGCSDTP